MNDYLLGQVARDLQSTIDYHNNNVLGEAPAHLNSYDYGKEGSVVSAIKSRILTAHTTFDDDDLLEYPSGYSMFRPLSPYSVY